MRLPDLIPGLGAKGDRPRWNPAVGATTLGLSPVEGFVYSRVDGSATYEQICALTGLEAAATLEILRKLKRMGAILDTTAVVSYLARMDDGSPVAPDELIPGPGLPPETKAQILRLHRRLHQLSPEQLLGVPPAADPVALRRAYTDACKEVHPDRHHGRDLGPFRGKLAEIFARLTDAFHVLHRP